ncbi:hypothetical protein D3C77_628520 [compost metagenome]
MNGQQRISAITLGCIAQRRRIGTFKILGRCQQLFVEVRQRQTQWQTAVLGRTAQRLGTALAIADQA